MCHNYSLDRMHHVQHSSNEVPQPFSDFSGLPGIWTFRPRTYPVGDFPSQTFPPEKFPLPPFTRCNTFPFHHHHLPIYNTKPSTGNVYKTDKNRSVRVRSTGWCQFSLNSLSLGSVRVRTPRHWSVRLRSMV